jgi:hypothetical protein
LCNGVSRGFHSCAALYSKAKLGPEVTLVLVNAREGTAVEPSAIVEDANSRLVPVLDEDFL